MERNLWGVVIVQSLDYLMLIHLRVICAYPAVTFELSQAPLSHILVSMEEGREEEG